MSENDYREITRRLDENDKHIESLSDGLEAILQRLDSLEGAAKQPDPETPPPCPVCDTGGQNPDGSWIGGPCDCGPETELKEENDGR